MVEPENYVGKAVHVDSLQSSGKKSIMGLMPTDAAGIKKRGEIDTLNNFLKDIMGFVMKSETPPSIPEISKALNERDFLVTSAVRNLEALGLMEKSEDGRFMLSGKGTAYMSMSELEHRIYENKTPFVLYRDENGTMTNTKPDGWDSEE